MKAYLTASRTVERFRETATDFTRTRLLSLPVVVVVVLILRAHKGSLQNGLNKVFEELGQVRRVPTASAYCQARRKVKPDIFVELNAMTCQDYYRLEDPDHPVQTWHGRRLIGFDGTLLNLPDTPELRLRAAFSVQRNQHGDYVQALAGVLYDLCNVCNDIGLAGTLGPVQGESKLLLQPDMWAATQAGDVLVLDRAFVDYALIAWAVKNRREVVMRCPRRGFTQVLDFWDSPDTERLVRLHVPQTHTPRQFVRDHALPELIPVRLLKFTLPTGEPEVVLTTLCDAHAYPRPEFYPVYGARWGQETFFDRLKNVFEVERFSGVSERAVRQDFFGVLFLATLESVLTQPAQADLHALDEQRHTLTRARVNRVVSYVALVNHGVELLADPSSSPEETLDELHHLFLQNPTRHRDGRHFPRPKLKHSRKLRFHRYTKRVIA